MRTPITVALAVAAGFVSVTRAAALEIPIPTGQFTWNWEQGEDGPAEQFIMRCGTAPDSYTLAETYPSPATRSAPVSDLIDNPGTYFCRAYAWNQDGESPGSNEVTFNAILPAPPPPPEAPKPGKRKGHNK